MYLQDYSHPGASVKHFRLDAFCFVFLFNYLAKWKSLTLALEGLQRKLFIQILIYDFLSILISKSLD